MELVTPELWQGCIREAIKHEDKFWERDQLIDKELTPVVPNPNLCFTVNNSDDSETSDSNESSSDSD